jgi:hypothetical protein
VEKFTDELQELLLNLLLHRPADVGDQSPPLRP